MPLVLVVCGMIVAGLTGPPWVDSSSGGAKELTAALDPWDWELGPDLL